MAEQIVLNGSVEMVKINDQSSNNKVAPSELLEQQPEKQLFGVISGKIENSSAAG